MSNFYDKVFEEILKHEGGFTDDPQDPGNWTGGSKGKGELKGTKYGISAKAYPNLDIPNLTVQDAKEIYYTDYYQACYADQIPDILAYMQLDTSINMGVKASVQILQDAAGVVQDGIFGPKTKQAAKNVSIYNYAFCRMKRYVRIINGNNDLIKYGNGWSRRVDDVVKLSLSWAG